MARADSIFVGTLERPNVIIKELKGERLIFEISGRASELQASQITRLVVPSETALNSAEEAFASSKWNEAVDGFQRAMRTSSKAWVKDWAALRLINAAGKSGRFDAATVAYISALLKDPVAAAALKPAMPDSKSTFLDTSINDVNTALKDPKLTTDQRRALLGFLIDLQRAKKNQAGEDAAYEQLTKLPGGDANDASAKKVLARRRLTAATRALEAKNYAQAIKEIEAERSAYLETESQAEALFIVAEARSGLAGNDPIALKDAALAYMRVAALAKNEPARPRVVESIFKTAAILEKIGEPKTAALLYEQIVAQYPTDPATSQAKTSIERLRTN